MNVERFTHIRQRSIYLNHINTIPKKEMEKSKTKITGIANTEKYSQVQLYPEKVGELCSPAEVNIMENLENEKEFLTPSNLSKFVHCSHIFTQYRDGLKR